MFFVLMFLILIFWPIFVSAQSTSLLGSGINYLNINIEALDGGKLSVSEEFSLYDQNLTFFNYVINNQKISHLKVYKDNQELNKKLFKVKREEKRTVLYIEQDSIYVQKWQIKYITKGNFKIKGEKIEFRYQPVKNIGSQINYLNLAIKFPRNLDNYQTNLSLYAVHGVENSDYSYQGDTLYFRGANLSPYSTFTSVADLSKETIKLPLKTKLYSYLYFSEINFWLIIATVLPIIILMILSAMIFIKRIREHVKMPDQYAETPPNDMSPMLVGVLYRQKISAREIAAEIIDLSIRDYLVITEKSPGYNIGERQPLTNLKLYDKALADELLKGHLKESLAGLQEQPEKELYSKAVANIYKQAYDDIARRGYFASNPQSVALKYKLSGIILFFLSVLAFFSSPQFVDPPYIVFVFLGSAIASLIIIRLSNSMPRRTDIGQRALNDWLAFKKYLTEYPKEVSYSEIQQDEFIRYLPYAIALDCEGSWARHFARTPFKMPEWYITYRSVSTLNEFAIGLYPLIDAISKTILALKEPIL